MATNHSSKGPEGETKFPLSEHEWLFGETEVPREELVACACWEYLREVRAEDLGPKGLAGYALALLISYRNHPERRQFTDSFKRVPLRVLSFLADHPEQPFPLEPWQDLDPGVREELRQPIPRPWGVLIPLEVTSAGPISWVSKLPAPTDHSPEPRPWTQQADEAHAFVVAYSALYHSPPELTEALPQGADVDPPAPPAEGEPPAHDPRFWLRAYAANGLASPLPFLINWGGYTPEEIIDALQAWVRREHPKFAPLPRGAGKKDTDHRGHLRDLGAMRILKVMTEVECSTHHRDEYRLLQGSNGIGRPENRESYLNLARLKGRAVTYFETYFAVHADQKPDSWRPRRTKGKGLAEPTGELPF